jgi:hypothetical protein
VLASLLPGLFGLAVSLQGVWFSQLRSEPAMKAILAALIFTAAIVGQISTASAHSRQSRLSFALLMASLIIATWG